MPPEDDDGVLGPVQPKRAQPPVEEPTEDPQQEDEGAAAASMMSRVSGMAGTGVATGVGLAAAAARGGSESVGNVARRAGMLAVQAGTSVSAATSGALSVGAGTGVALGGIGVILSLVLSMCGIVLEQPGQRRDALVELCQDLEAQPNAPRGPSGGDIDNADMEENAKKVFSVLSYAGMNDENIAGIIGNFTAESGGMDPTAVERIADEPYEIGPRKQALWDETSEAYPLGFAQQPTGIGLAQWSWDRATNLLEYAEDVNTEWYNIEVQMAYMLSKDNPSDVAVVQEMIDGENPGANDPGAAALYFHDNWERSADSAAMAQRRADSAGQWYAKMGGWTVDTQLAASVLSQAGSAKRSANVKEMAAELISCPNLQGGTGGLAGGNGDAAEAMVSLSWPIFVDGKGNDGTDIYQFVHDEVYPGDPYYASCDRGVGTAVRWSGTDDDFPAGPVITQEQYVNGEGKDKWERVGSAHNEADLKPGDILIAPNHIEMYVGEEAVAAVWPNEEDHEPNAVIAHASLNDRSPVLDDFTAVTGDGRSFVAYRSKGRETDSQFTDIKVPAEMKPGVGDPNGPLTTPGPS